MGSLFTCRYILPQGTVNPLIIVLRRAGCLLLVLAAVLYPVSGLFAALIPGTTVWGSLPGRHGSPAPGFSGALLFFPAYGWLWLVGVLVVFFGVLFAGRISKEKVAVPQASGRAAEERAWNEEAALLAALAAAAAHELATPLSTIAVAAGEMLRSLEKHDSDRNLLEEAILIRSQVERCKKLLSQMASDGREYLSRTPDEFTLEEIMIDVLDVLSKECANTISFTNQVGDLRIRMPLRALDLVLRGMVRNARDASPPGAKIAIVARRRGREFLSIEVVDQGAGMDSETLDRACVPFFSTKEAANGMGLGLYLAKSVAERFGGMVRIESGQGRGTRVYFMLSFKQVAI